MLMSFICGLIISILTTTLWADRYCSVTFRVRTTNLPAQATVYITGNQRQLGNWQPDKVALQPIGANSFTRTFQFLQNTHLEYKFTLGSWATEACGPDGKVQSNFQLDLDRDTIVEYSFEQWGRQPIPTDSLRTRGVLRFHHQIRTPGLLPRDLAVWLPPDYDDNPTRRYPVLYLHDGQNLFTDQLAAFGVEWRVDETADSLIRVKAIEPIIIVGIYNTSERAKEYGPTKLGKAYRRFLIEVVKPLIDSTYRTLPDRRHTAVGGSSMGGLVAFMLVWENPSIFSKALCMSPAFKIQRLNYIQTVKKSGKPAQDLKFYIDNGGLDLEAKLQPGIDAMLESLDRLGFKRGVDYFWYRDPAAPHHEAAWAGRLPQALKWLFPFETQ